MIRAVNLPKNAPADQKMAMLAVGGAYQPQPSTGRSHPRRGVGGGKTQHVEISTSRLSSDGAMVAAVTATFGAMFQDFFGPKVLKEPKKVWRVGRSIDFASPASSMRRSRKPRPAAKGSGSSTSSRTRTGSSRSAPSARTSAAFPNWLPAIRSTSARVTARGITRTASTSKVPTPRPLERFAITMDADGYVMVDQTKVFRQELGEWEDPESFVTLL